MSSVPQPFNPEQPADWPLPTTPLVPAHAPLPEGVVDYSLNIDDFEKAVREFKKAVWGHNALIIESLVEPREWV